MSLIGMTDVLLASMQCGAVHRDQAGEDFLFERQFLGRRLDDEIRIANLIQKIRGDANIFQRSIVNALHLQVRPDSVQRGIA